MGYELSETKKNCIFNAKQLGDYQSLSVDMLADGYCAARDLGNKVLENSYMSALLLRFWYKINDLYVENRTLGLDHDDYFNWIAGAIMMACETEKRVWQTNEKVNAQTAIMQTLATRFKAQAYYEANLDIHKANYNNMRLDTKCDEEESETSFLDNLSDDRAILFEKDVEVESIVQGFINKNKLVEAIIVDNIAFNDANKVTKETIKVKDPETGEIKKITQYSTEFWKYRLVQILNTLPEHYAKYFTKRYNVNTNAFDAALNSVKTTKNSKLYKVIANTIVGLKTAMAI